jgi:hypothetical protein
MGWRAAVLGWDDVLEACVGRTVPFKAPVSISHPRRLTTGAPYQAWGTGTSRGATGEFKRRGGTTFVVGPPVPCFDLHAWTRP